MLGLNFKTMSHILKHCKLNLRRLLRSSKNKDINVVYQLKKDKFMKEDQILRTATSKDDASKLLQTSIIDKVIKHLDELRKQSVIMKVLKENLSNSDLQNG